MKKTPVWLIVALLLALLIGIKFLFFPKQEAGKNKPGAKGGAAPVAANYEVVALAEVPNNVYTTGQIGSFNQVQLQTEIAGRVTNVLFKDGQHVNKGALLLILNDADLKAQLHKIDAQMQLAEQKVKRLKRLLEIQGVSQEEYDIQANEYKALQADKEYLLAQQAKTKLVAPFDGVIGLKNVSVGSFLSPNQVWGNLVQLAPLFVEFSLPEKYSRAVKKGTMIYFQSEDALQVNHPAEVYAFEPQIDLITKTLKTRALVKADLQLLPGAFVKVNVPLSGLPKAIMIPTQAIVPVLKGQKVFVCKNGKAQAVMIETGLRTDKSVQVLSGLIPGDTLITTGLLAIKPDSPVKLIKPNK